MSLLRLFGFLASAGLLSLTREGQGASLQITKGPWIQRVSLDAAIVRVEVTPPTPVTLELTGPTSAGSASDAGTSSLRVITDQEPVTLHTINVNDLLPSTRYTYVVKAGALSKMGAFVTAPPTDSDAAFRFLVYGDNRTDDAAHAAVVRSMVPIASDFLIHTGDFVETGNSARDWQTFFDIEAPLLSSRCLYSAVGNHELTDGAGIEYARFFGPTDVALQPGAKGKGLAVTKPEHLNGTFRWGNTRFFLLNGLVSFKAAATDRVWLEKALSESDAEPGIRWRIVVIHHGPWSSGPHGMSARLQEAGVVQVFKQHKVDLVLSGHDHIYERGWGDGLPFIVSGGGGAPVYKIKKRSPESRKAESVRHFVQIDVSATGLQTSATRMDGSTIERCGLSKGAAFWDCDGSAGGTSGSRSPESTSTTTSSSSSGGSGTGPTPSRCSCEVAGACRASDSAFSAAAVLAVVLSLATKRRRSIL